MRVYEFFCVLGVLQWIIVHECVCVFDYKKMCLAAVIEEEDSVLKLHQHREINQSSAVINNRVIRSFSLSN